MMEPLNVPDVAPVILFANRLTVKLPLASAYRPVPAYNIVRFDNRYDVGVTCGTTLSPKAGENGVAVGCDKTSNPISPTGGKVHHPRIHQGEWTKLRGGCRGAPIHIEHERWNAKKLVTFAPCDSPIKGYLSRFRRGASEGRGQEHCC